MEGSSFSGFDKGLIRLKKTRKNTLPKMPVFDYGRDRDVDVEGVEDYVMWHENFKTDAPLPVIPR